MIVKGIEIHGFLGQKEPLSLEFYEDLNIITGFNGVGKTNLMKLIWYTISGNIYPLINEIQFSSFSLTTDKYYVKIHKVSNNTCRGNFIDSDGDEFEFEDQSDDDFDISSDARDQFKEQLYPIGGSIYFPTFRRIEGGYTLQPSNNARTNNALFNIGKPKGDVPEAIAAISNKLSNGNHTFISSVSTADVSELLLRQFNEMSEEANNLQTKMSQDVVSKIRDFRRDTARDSTDKVGEEAVSVLEDIKNLIEEVDKERERITSPLRAVHDMVRKIFKHKSIQVNRRVSFGDAVNAINSDLLSAGEKQMLSFICYNAFTNDCPIFIDEPELSLHVDWQRILFPTLQSQAKKNQFIIATHSPFIYGKYPDKEIQLSEDRGDNELINA